MQTGNNGHPFGAISRYRPLCTGELRLYDTLREAIPIIDAAIYKTVRLVGGFCVRCENKQIEAQLCDFLQQVRVNGCGQGIAAFTAAYLEQLLTYGTAVGEIVTQNGKIAALYNASLEDVELKAENSPLDVKICRKELSGESKPVAFPELVMASALHPRPGEVYGESVLKGLPFVSGILLKIYNSIGLNWERVGNVRFAVTYKPGSDAGERAYAKERAMGIAKEWSRAMQAADENGKVSDFVAVGDVSIKVIGADNQVLDSEVPVRQMLEQIVAKLGIPPFLLGLSWSSTERMSMQQADVLTSELEAYRTLLQPVIGKICGMWLRLNGCPPQCEIVWDNITLQDEVELASARLANARAEEIEKRQKERP